MIYDSPDCQLLFEKLKWILGSEYHWNELAERISGELLHT